MRGPASPVFTTRIADVTPAGMQSLLELRLFFPGETAAVDSVILESLQTSAFSLQERRKK